MQVVQHTQLTNKTKATPKLSGLAGWLLRLLCKGRNLFEEEEKHLHLLEALSLGGRRQLILVSCEKERFLIGGSVDKIEVIVPIKPGLLSEMAKI